MPAMTARTGSPRAVAASGEPAVPVRADLALRAGYHSPRVEVDVRLNMNESPLPPPPSWLASLQEALAAIDFNRYPDRRAWALRSALAERHGVEPDQVFCANGSNEALQCLLLAFGGPGRSVAVFEPTYALHSHIARITATTVVTGRRQADFSLDWEEVGRVLASARPSVTFLCSPNNPTGRSESPEEVEEVLDRAPGLVVVDEAYGQFSAWSALSLMAGSQGSPRSEGFPGSDGPAPDRLVVVRTFSKTWSMAAARLGYLVAPAPVVAALEQVTLPYHLDAVKQVAGRLALELEDEMQARVGLLVSERQRICAGLAALPVEWWPSDANFVLWRPLNMGGPDLWQALVDRSVLIRDCSGWPGLEGCLRVTVGTQAENTRFLGALAQVLDDRPHRS